MTAHKNIFAKTCVIMATVFCVGGANADQAPNPRGATGVASVRADVRGATRNASGTSAVVSRAATSHRTVAGTSRGGVVNGARTASRTNTVVSGGDVAARSAVSVPRASTANVARSGVVTGGVRGGAAATVSRAVSRASVARATAVFDDVSKIGGGYATCREAYATCMDQFCAKANDTYRRCFCSSKYTEFKDTEAALDEAKTLLVQFESNNLNAVDKTAAEVNAMYSATAGEQAIKNDTSGAAVMLSEIGDLLSGKKKASTQTTGNSLGVLDLDFSTDIDDIWGNSGASSIFSNNTGTDLSSLEGTALFSQANKQCLALIKDSCENNAVLNMAKSAYNIMISQDCNAYEKKINSQRETIKQTVRTAEKYLRDARLDEYRAHNTADVNECIAKVKSAITADTACGANYKRCLDYTGAYIDPNTGEPNNYSPRLFELENLITLDGVNGTADVLAQNTKFNNFLETRKMFATTALDSCRDISNTVWQEFKRSALIEIAQAQSAKLEEIKMSCVSTIAECYDTQTNALKDFDTTTAKASGAVSAYAAKVMCQDKVTACAALYGNNSTCQFDGNGRLTSDSGSCGLKALLAFVDTVDTVRVAEGCASAIDNYVQTLCTPTSGDQGFPWNCRKKAIGSVNASTVSSSSNASLADNIRNFALQNCKDPTNPDATYDMLPVQTRVQVQKAIEDISEQLDAQLGDMCEALDGYWLDAGDNSGKDLVVFYTSVFGNSVSTADTTSMGRCVENTTMIRCLAYNTGQETPVASYDRTKDECIFTKAWYRSKCESLGGYYDENSVCYVAK